MPAAGNRSKLRAPDDFGRVVQFPRRRMIKPHASASPENVPADAIAGYEQDRDEAVDDRHRMLMNFIAITIVTLLIGAGVWIADTIGDMERDLNCVIQGRANCAPIEAAISTQR